MDFEWDSAKAVANFRKHGVSFEEAVSALRDDLAATARDLAHSVVESTDSLPLVSLPGVGYLRFRTLNVGIEFESSAHA